VKSCITNPILGTCISSLLKVSTILLPMLNPLCSCVLVRTMLHQYHILDYQMKGNVSPIILLSVIHGRVTSLKWLVHSQLAYETLRQMEWIRWLPMHELHLTPFLCSIVQLHTYQSSCRLKVSNFMQNLDKAKQKYC
jgi:hypothetical protein